MSNGAAKVHFVGSMPRDTVEEVFEVCVREAGDYIVGLPDGEVGDRTDFTTFVAYRLFAGNPQFETLTRPWLIEGKKAEWHMTDLYDNTWLFKIKDDVKYPQFDNIHYADAAIESYGTFRAFREEGKIPAHIRFQVCLPAPYSAMGWWFHNPEDYDRVALAYMAAMTREVKRIVEAIPSADLAIQWDYPFETLDIAGAYPWTPKYDPWVRYAMELLPLSMNIPADVLLGFHFCYGDIVGEHSLEPPDLEVSVKMANLAIHNSGRRIDWVHMPVPISRADDDYFGPLQKLDAGNTRVHLGLVHHDDGVEGTMKRVEVAKKYLPDFGVATECGMARRDPETFEGLLQIHCEVADLLS